MRQSRINHMFVGNFSIEEQILVAKDHMCESGYLPCTDCLGFENLLKL